MQIRARVWSGGTGSDQLLRGRGEIMISESSRHGAPELERAGERVKHKGCALCSWPRVWVWRLSPRTHTHTDREKQRAVVSIAISNRLRIPRGSSGERLHNTHTHALENQALSGGSGELNKDDHANRPLPAETALQK